MDQNDFDALTVLVTEDGTRRGLLRLLAGSALGAVAARLGLAEQAAAKAKQHKGKAKRKHHPVPSQPHQADHAAAKSPGHPTSSGVQGERKRKGKGKRKRRQKPPPLPPGCEHCTACQMCKDGACVPDPALAGVPCLGSGPTCSHCLLGVCTANEQLPCDDGICVRRGQCCPGEKYCSDPESSTGFACVGETDCCPGQKKCDNGTCVTLRNCCPGQKNCPDGSCVKETECCAGQQRCGGTCCLAGEECCNGYCEVTADGPWIPCGDGACITTQVYQCCGEKVCWADSDCCGDRCCPAPHKCCGTTCCFGSA